MPLGTAEESKTIHQERRRQARETAERTAKMQAVFISDCSESLDFPWGNLSLMHRCIQATILFSKQHHSFKI